MENKIKIGIDINEVIRSLWTKFDKCYIDEFGDENVNDDEVDSYTNDFWNVYKWEERVENVNYLNEELPENISPLEYVVNENGEAPVDFMAFRKKTETTPAYDVYKQFMFVDYCLEIFGMSTLMYKNQDRDINKIYLKYKDHVEFYVISKENYFTIPPTLFFLSKNSLRFKNYIFVEDEKEYWNHVDVLLTANNNLIKNKPAEKKVVKFERPFNTKNGLDEIKGDLNIINTFDLLDNSEFDELINFKKIEKNGE